MKHISTAAHTIIRLHKGDDIVPSIERAMKENHMRNAIVLFGVGSVESAEFGILPPKGPHVRHFHEGLSELVYLSGFIVGEETGGPYGPHLHIAVADTEGFVRGGHLFRAVTGEVAEVGISPVYETRIKRVPNKERNVELLEM